LKYTVQCSAKNKNEVDVNYSIYILGMNDKNELVFCTELEPMMNIHEAGKFESLENSGLILDSDQITKLGIRMIVEKQ